MARAFALVVWVICLGALAVSASDIDNCCFVDRQCQSDQDWVNGYWAFQKNQCHAPASSQPTGVSAQIDNCCFIDRQCTTDQEWTDGYHAYQNNQCAVPAGSGAPTSSQTVSASPAHIDNCCFLDRQCQTVQDYWVEGYHAFQNNQCGAPGQLVLSVDQADNKRRALRIEGSARLIAAVNAALDLLKARAPHWYVYTVFGHDWILAVPKGTIVSSPLDVNVHLVHPDNIESTLQRDAGSFAGYLVHYAAHNYQHQRYLAGPGLGAWVELLEDEREALTVQIEAMEACCPGHPWLPGFRHLLTNIDQLEYQWWHD